MSLPRFITFTGADNVEDIPRMRELSSRYPIEWGILFSESNRGHPRYPSYEVLEALFETAVAENCRERFRLSAHLCGKYSGYMLELGGLPIFRDFDLDGFLLHCERVQINTAQPITNALEMEKWAGRRSLKLIFQCTRRHPYSLFGGGIEWLLDASGGRGISPDAWPRPMNHFHATHVFKGYAGGLNPENVLAAVQTIGQHDANYYLDMESGVRTVVPPDRTREGSDVFDLDKCEAVCRAVYGDQGLKL